MLTDKLLQALPSALRSELGALSDAQKSSLCEIRMLCERPTTLLFFDRRSKTESVLSAGELSDVYLTLCGYRLYAHCSELSWGYLPLEGGNRAGICGTYTGDERQPLRDVSAIVLRLSSEHRGCADALVQAVGTHSSLLICGAPGSGKTTLLRDYVRIAASEPHLRRCCIIDSRGELAATRDGRCGYDVGGSLVLDLCSKRQGFSIALRTLTPELIACDELDGDSDMSAVCRAATAGCAVAATAHVGSQNALPQGIKQAVDSGVFKYLVMLSQAPRPATIERILKVK